MDVSNPKYGLKQHQKPNQSIGLRLLLIVFALVLPLTVFSVWTTQNIAKTYDYHASLGVPITGTYYAPLQWWHWYRAFGSTPQHQPIFHRILRLNLMATVLGFGGVYFLILYAGKRSQHKHPHLHGSARFADYKTIQKMGILDNQGVAIGAFEHQDQRHYLWHDGPEHVMAFAPTRSGKGVGLVIPTLLSWPHSVVIYDVKKENWSLSGAWRRNHAGNTVLRFEPGCSDGTAACFNPLDEIRLGTDYDVSDVQNIAHMIMDDEGRGLQDYWMQAGYDFLYGVILHATYKAHNEGRSATLTDIAYSLSDPDHPIEVLLEEMLNYPHKDGDSHIAVAQVARTMANKAAKELSGVLGTVIAKLSLYRDPIVSKNIGRSDFCIADLMNAEKPVSLYICVGVRDKDRLRPLTRLVLTQILRGLATEVVYKNGQPAKNYRHRLLMLIDEFPSLGRLEVFEESLAYLAGYGIKCYLIVQDLSQLRSEKAYGRSESILSNCHVRVAYAPNKLETAEELSKMTGITTITKKNISSSKRGAGVFAPVHQNISYQEQQRYLLTADEVMRLRGIEIPPKGQNGQATPGDMLIFIAGQSVIYGQQILYFIDPILQARAALGAPATSDRMNDKREGETGMDDKDSFSRRFAKRYEAA